MSFAQITCFTCFDLSDLALAEVTLRAEMFASDVKFAITVSAVKLLLDGYGKSE